MKRGLVAVALLAACSRSEPTTPAEPTPPPDPMLVAPASVIPSATTQLITAIVPDWTDTHAELRLWTRDGAGWKPVGPAWPGVVGKSGSAWGVGLHGTGAPARRSGPIKREGDGKSPAGVFALTGSYGYAAKPPAGATLAYTPVDPSWKCVDDPASRHYNQVLDARTTTIDWTSAEDMRRPDALYAWVVEVAHNPARTAGTGSCIFLHVWSGAEGATLGCTAMDEGKLAQLIATLSPAQAPAFVLLPRAEYDALADAWSLPRD